MQDLATIRAEVFNKRPVLGEIDVKFGTRKLRDYVKVGWEMPKQKPDQVFLNMISHFSNTIFGGEIATSIKNQLLKKPLVSTIDHLGIWGHPIFVNADLIYSLHFNSQEFAICLATESVSLNNTTSWSSSVLKHDDTGNLHRYSFFPDKLKTLPVFSAPAINESDILRFKKNVNAEVILGALKIDTTKNSFSNQSCHASYNLWQKVFPSAPKLIYLPLESMVLEYIKNIIGDGENIIAKLILTSEGRELWQKYFSNEHTFMFWGIDEKGRRQILRNFPDRGNLLKLIEDRKIYPSSPLCFMVLLYSGLSCVGGFTQTTWLTEVKKKFVNLLEDLKISQSVISNITNIPTKNFAESSLASLKIGENVVLPTAVDLLITNKDYYPEFFKKAQNITLGESLDQMMPEIYEIIKNK